MALSEQEQRLLAQLEADLLAEDPQLAHTLRSASTPHIVNHRRALFALGGLVGGVALLIVGMEVSPLVSVLGFVLMLVASLTGIASIKVSEHPQQVARDPHEISFLDHLDDRLHRRPDDTA